MIFSEINGCSIQKTVITNFNIYYIYNKTMDALDSNIFEGKKFSDLFKEIYENQKKKEKQISALISELKPLIQEIGDATLIVPLIKEYLEISIKNDEQLIKMANIIQRALQNQGSSNEVLLTEAEKAQLFSEVSKYNPDKK